MRDATAKMQEWQQRKMKMRHDLDKAKSRKARRTSVVRRHSQIGRLDIEGLKADTALYLRTNLGNVETPKVRNVRERAKILDLQKGTTRTIQRLWFRTLHIVLTALTFEKKIRKSVCSLRMFIQFRV
jgi:hypothetical protein